MMPPEISSVDVSWSIRKARSDDAKAISSLIVGLLPLVLDDPSNDAPAFRASTSPEAAAERLADSDFHFLVAEHDDHVIGVAAMRNGSHLHHLFVEAAWHRRGVGQALWSRLIEHCPAPRITVNSSLYAVPVYRRLGFVADGEVINRDGLLIQPMVLQRSND